VINPALVVGILAAVVAILGYAITNAMNRIERRSKIYADAMLALVQFENLPFRIRRRSDSSDATRTIVGQRVRDVQEALFYHTVLLRLASPRVGAAFKALVEKTREKGVRYRHDAWTLPPARSDADMSLEIRYDYKNKDELDECILLMQRELSIIRALSPRARWFKARH
jgi:hypothetical protein